MDKLTTKTRLLRYVLLERITSMIKQILKRFNMKQWFLIENEKSYTEALNRYEKIKQAKKGTDEHKEKLLVAFLINQYEEKQWDMPDVDPVEFIKIRMEEFGYKPSDLANEYGDKGTISKVLNYKQPLS